MARRSDSTTTAVAATVCSTIKPTDLLEMSIPQLIQNGVKEILVDGPISIKTIVHDNVHNLYQYLCQLKSTNILDSFSSSMRRVWNCLLSESTSQAECQILWQDVDLFLSHFSVLCLFIAVLCVAIGSIFTLRRSLGIKRKAVSVTIKSVDQSSLASPASKAISSSGAAHEVIPSQLKRITATPIDGGTAIRRPESTISAITLTPRLQRDTLGSLETYNDGKLRNVNDVHSVIR